MLRPATAGGHPPDKENEESLRPSSFSLFFLGLRQLAVALLQEAVIGDNGPGWPEALLPSLLKPFTTSKEVGLGIGLSICVSLMEQMKGELRLASTMTRNACVVLQFRLTDVEDAK